MQDQQKTKAELIAELQALRTRVATLEQARDGDRPSHACTLPHEHGGATALLEFHLDGALPSWIYDVETLALLEVNDAATQHYGYSREEFLRLNLKDIRPAEDIPALLEYLAKLGKQHHNSVSSWRHIKKNGALIDVDVIVHPIRFHSRDAYLAFIQDVTPQKRAARTLAGQQQFFEQLATGAPLDTTLESLIRKIETQLDGGICSIQLLDADGLHLWHGAVSLLPPAYEHAIDGAAIGPSAGSCGTSAFRNETVIVTDIASDPLWDDYRKLALSNGLHACWSIPFHDSHKRILGTFAIYYREPRAPTAADQEVLKHAAYLAAVAVEWKRTEAALRASERRYRALADAIPLLIWTTSPAGVRDYYNQRCDDYFGVTFAQLASKDWQKVVYPHDRSFVLDSRLTALACGEAHTIECRLKRHDGAYRWHLLHELPIRNEAGQITFWVGTATDIDDQRRDQEALRESETRYRLVSRATNDVIWDWDIPAQTITWNECAHSVFGFTLEQMGNHLGWWREHLHPEDREHTKDSIYAAVNSAGQFWASEYRLLRADQSYAHILDRGYVIRDAGGMPVRMIGAMQDITDRKRAEAEVRRLNAQLEQRVVERTSQLEVANKELEAFSYSVSHDLRAPLRHIDGFARLLAQREGARLDETSARYVRVIGDAARKMGQLIDDLLAFSRMSRTEMQTLPVDLTHVVADAQHELAPMCDGRNISWTVDPLPIVHGDPALIRLVFVNLLSNALKYSAPRPEAQIAIHSSSAADGWQVISISDNGVGFDMQYAHKLFGVFQRLHRDEEFEGTGIGLATVQRILNRHGGRIWAESAPDQGATFHLTLKRHRSDDANEENPTSGR